MKKVIPILIVLGMLGWAIFEYVSSSSEPDNTSPTLEEAAETDEIGLDKNQIAPDFEIMTLDGNQMNLSDYRGKRVMLNFWATWCPPCRAEMPDIQKLYDQEDIAILAVNMTASEKNEAAVTEFVDDFELTFPILMDREAEIVELYQVQAYPTSYMIDSNGKIQFMVRGAMNYDQMVQLFNRLN